MNNIKNAKLGEFNLEESKGLDMFSILLLLILIIAAGVIADANKESFTAETGFIYEYGIGLQVNGGFVENKVFYDIPIGISIWSSDNKVVNCSFIGCSDEGIYIVGSNNTVVNCVFYGCCDGIELVGSSNNTFAGCVFICCSHAGVDVLSGSFGNVFCDCVFVDSTAVFIDQCDNVFVDCWFDELSEVKDYHDRQG